jgi:DNA-binding NarL/FixJ family response regulator
MVRVLVADDHPMVRSGLRQMLDSADDIDVVGEADTGSEAVRATGRLEPDVVLMDLRMPDLDGVAATAEIRRRYPDVHVLVVTTYDTDADIYAAIDAGAIGYLLKDARREELYAAVRAAARGETTLAPRVASRVLDQVRGADPTALTRRELDVLQLVAAGHRNRDIAHDLHIGEATVKSHLLHLYGKLGVDDRTHAVTVAIERGILRIDQPAQRQRRLSG